MERPRHCARPACAAPAVAALSFDYVARVAWLDDLGVDDEPSSYDLCALHAERLRVPRGWAREDRRGPVSPFRVPPLERLGEPVAVQPSAAVRWGLGDVLLGFGVALLTSTVVLGAWAVATGEATVDELSLAGVVVAQLTLWSGYLGVPLLASRRKGAGSLAVDFGLDVRPSDARRGVPIGLLCQLVLVPVLYLPFRTLIDRDDLDAPARELAEKAHGIGFFVLAVVLVLGAPIVEELFFRGLLMRALARRYGDRWALAGSSVVFGLAHVELIQLPALIAVGAVFGWLALRAGRLGPAVWAHGAFNAVVVVLLAAERQV